MFRRGSLSRGLLIIGVLLLSQFPVPSIEAQTKLTIEEAQEWFCTGTSSYHDLEGLSITISREKGVLPSVEVPANPSCGNRPALTFKLLSAFGEGLPSIFIKDKVWYTFEAFQKNGDDETRVEPLFFSVSDTEDTNFIFSRDLQALKKGKYADETGNVSVCLGVQSNCELARASTNNAAGELMAKSIRQLSALTNNFPEGDDSCETPSADNGEDPVRYVGPKGNNATTQGTADPAVGPTAAPTETTSSSTGQNDYESLDDTERFSNNKEHPNVLNRDCLAGHDGGWLKAWGLTNDNIFVAKGILEGDCAINKIVAGGLGSAVGTLTACLVSVILTGMLDWAAQWVQEAAGLSWRPNQGSAFTSYYQHPQWPS